MRSHRSAGGSQRGHARELQPRTAVIGLQRAGRDDGRRRGGGRGGGCSGAVATAALAGRRAGAWWRSRRATSERRRGGEQQVHLHLNSFFHWRRAANTATSSLGVGAVVGVRGLRHRGFARAQEGIDLLFQRRWWRAGWAGRARAAARTAPVVGAARRCRAPPRVANLRLESVYSWVQHTRVSPGRAASLSSECEHLRRRAFEQAAAAAGEQRVAAEEQRARRRTSAQ